MLEFRPVDCGSGAPLRRFVPGEISRSDIYGPDGTAPGWSWFPYFDAYSAYAVPGLPDAGLTATCRPRRRA